MGKRFPSRKKFGSLRRAKAKVMRSTFYCLEVIIPRAEGSARACHRSILAKKKSEPTVPHGSAITGGPLRGRAGQR